MPKNKKSSKSHSSAPRPIKYRPSFSKKVGLFFGLIFAAIGTAALLISLAATPYKSIDFSSDPAWEGVNNRPASSIACVTRKSDFGWSNSSNAGAAKGEIGGRIENSLKQAYYAKKLDTTKSFNDHLYASGTLLVPQADDAGVNFGWFNSKTSLDWRAADFLGMRISDGNSEDRPLNRASMDVGSANNLTEGSTALPYPPGAVPNGEKVSWTIEYNPTEGTYGTAKLKIIAKGKEYLATRPLTDHQRADGATFDHFGFLNVQTGDRDNRTVYIDDLTLNSGAGGSNQTFNFDSDPGWEELNNHLNEQDCQTSGRHDFGWQANSSFAGGSPGEMGGLIWVSNKNAYYADPIPALTLNDRLYASGRINLYSAHYDTDIPWVGWFNSSSIPEGRNYKNIIGGRIGGTGSSGYHLMPDYWNKDGARDSAPEIIKTPSLTPKKQAYNFWICYEPNADTAGNGRLTVNVLGSSSKDQKTELLVSKTNKDTGATFNRFGVQNFIADANATIFYLDDLRYTTAPGDSGPVEHCGSSVGGGGGGSTDKTPPNVNLTAPAAGATVTGPAVPLSANATDDIGVAGVQFKLDGVALANEDPAAPYAAILDSTKVGNGSHSLTATARDAAGNRQDASVPVTVSNSAPVDQTPPTISLTAPPNNISVDVGTIVNASATAGDNVGVAGVQFKLDGNNLGAEDTTSPYELAWDTKGVETGAHNISAVARDAAGNSTKAGTNKVNVRSSSVVVPDTTPPSVPDKLRVTAVNAQTARLNWDASKDNSGGSGLAGYKVYRDGGLLKTVGEPNFQDEGLTTGRQYKYAVSALDRAGNESARSKELSVTTVDQAPRLAITYPADGAHLRGSLRILVSATDDAGISSVKIKLGKQSIVDTQPPYSASWDTTQTADKEYTIEAIAIDTAGHEISTKIKVTVDNEPPTIKIAHPRPNAQLKGKADFYLKADDNAELQDVQWLVDGQKVRDKHRPPFKYHLDTSHLSKGAHKLSAQAKDAAGNITKTEINVTVR